MQEFEVSEGLGYVGWRRGWPRVAAVREFSDRRVLRASFFPVEAQRIKDPRRRARLGSAPFSADRSRPPLALGPTARP